MQDIEALAKYLVSTVLGYAIVAGSLYLKVPQIVAILRSKSAEGVSLSANLIEAFVFTISASWGVARGLDFKDYGENIFILAQLLVLVVLIGYHTNKIIYGLSVLVLILSFGAAMAAKTAPALHEQFLKFQIVFSLSSRVPQIYMNYRNRATGQLSFTTYFLAFGGGGARVLTTFFNIPWADGKLTLLIQYAMNVLLNGVILVQIVVYKGRNAAASPKKAKAASPKRSASGEKKRSSSKEKGKTTSPTTRRRANKED